MTFPLVPRFMLTALRRKLTYQAEQYERSLAVRSELIEENRSLRLENGELHRKLRELVRALAADREPEPVQITAEMVEQARRAGALWFSEHPDGASTDEEWREHYRSGLRCHGLAMTEVDAITDYRCRNGHVFSVPWGDEAPRSTVVCPRCQATAFIEALSEPPPEGESE